jgi:hypothetical protein
MEREHAETSFLRRGVQGGLANKQAADSRANALASTIRDLRDAGFISRWALADELNRLGIPTANGGKWHRTTVTRMLMRLGLITWGKDARINNGQAKKKDANTRAKGQAPTIAKIQRAGFVSIRAITRELHEREIPTPKGGKWHPTSVKRLLQRLKRLEASSRTGVTPGD